MHKFPKLFIHNIELFKKSNLLPLVNETQNIMVVSAINNLEISFINYFFT